MRVSAHMIRDRRLGAVAALAVAGATATTVAASGQSAPDAPVADRPPLVLEVDASKPLKPVDHAASGSLYGLADDGWPADRWIAPTKPKMFTQPPPGATHRPNGEPAPVGDASKVWDVAERHGATVTIRLPDIFPTFPYQWLGDDYWYAQVERIVRETKASGMDNIYGYEIWNEPQWTWNPSWGDFDEMWARTYRLIRSIDPDTPIIGPSHDREYMTGIEEFLKAAVASGTVPDIISWHELGPETGLSIGEHVARYREIERELGIGPLPISINEYGSPRDAGVPGWLTRFVSKLERARVDTANLAFWHKPGRLSDLLVPVGGGSGPAFDAEPTGNYWLFKWYADMTGNTVETTPPAESGRTIEVGEPTPAPATRVPSRPGSGNAIALGGSDPNRYVELPPGVVGGLTDFTVSTWVNIRTLSTWSRVFDFGSGTGTYMFLTPRSGSGTARFAITTSGGGAGEQQINGNAPLPTGWTHVAVTKSGSTGTLYVNGEAVGSNPNMTLSPSDLAGGNTTSNWIGRSQYPDPLLDALIDDFQIYDHALTAEQLRAQMDRPANGNVVAYRFDEAGGETVVDASGGNRNGRVITRIEGVEHLPAPDGFASADRRTGTVRVVFGGGEGDLQLKVRGLDALQGFGRWAEIHVSTTEWTGTDGVSEGPVKLFEGRYPVRDGRISVPLDGLVDKDAYLAVIKPARRGHGDTRGDRRQEGEDLAGGRRRGISPLASNNQYALLSRGDAVTFNVHAPTAGAYDLRVRYSTPAEATVEVRGGASELVELAPTGRAAPFATHRTHVVLRRGGNRIRLTARSGSLGLDYVEAIPFRQRFEAEAGRWTGASLVRVDMSEANFFAPTFSGDAYVRGLSEPASSLRLPVTVPAEGRYRLKIGYSTAGTETERRAQIQSKHILRVDDGPWQVVSYDPTQFREMLRQTTAYVQLPAGTSTLTLAKGDPSYPGGTQPGTVDLDYVDVQLAP